MDSEKISWAVLGVFALKELWQTFKSDKKEAKELLKDNTQATHQNTLAIVKLQVQLEQILKATESIPEIKNDLDHAHRMIRDMRQNQ